MADDNDEEVDVLDFLAAKGLALDPFRNEFVDLQKQLEILQATNVSKEREIDLQTLELKMLREQVTFMRRNVDELVSQQELLKESIENARNKTELLVDHEYNSREEISTFANLFVELKEALSVGADWTPDQAEQRISLERERDFLASKLENKNNSLGSIRSGIEKMYEDMLEMEKDIQSCDEQIEQVEHRRVDVKKQTHELTQTKELIEKKIFDLRATFTQKEVYLEEHLRSCKMQEKDLRLLDESIVKSKHQMEVYINQYEALYRTLTEVTNHLEKQTLMNAKTEEELQEKTSLLTQYEHEMKTLEKEMKLKKQLKEMAQKKCQEVDAEKHQVELKIDQLNKKMLSLREAEVQGSYKEREILDKQITSLKQEVEILRKKTMNSEKSSKAVQDLIALNHNGKINLNIEIRILEEEVEQHKKNIKHLLAEKEKYEHDTEMANQQYYSSLEELKLQELQVHELNKKISSDQLKLKQKQSLYETVRSDRNLFSKQLIDAQEEIQNLKRKFRSMNNMIDQMKEDISIKDHAIVKEHFLHHSVDKERELLKNELTKIKKQVQASEGIIENQRVEIMKLQRIIDEADQERQRQKNELMAVLSERNLLTAQLVKRNSELNEMYERIKTMRANLKIGERHFTKNVEELHHWQQEIQQIVVQHQQTIQALAEKNTLQRTVQSLEKEIMAEKTRARALMDELQTPMNVHRWRILESSDPKRYEKVHQIHLLQKQFVSMSDQLIRYDLSIQEKEQIYSELKMILARHPGPEIEEQILLYQQTYKQKQKQLQAMNAELEMYIEQVRVFKEDIAQHDAQLGKLNKQWVKQAKKQRLAASLDASADYSTGKAL